jgi:hypothetical protein
MNPHRILKNFKGSQNGHDHHEFKEGTTVVLSKDLAAIVVKEGWAEPVTPLAALTAPVVGLKQPIPEGDLQADLDNPAEIDEAKSIDAAPENKAIAAAPENKKRKK